MEAGKKAAEELSTDECFSLIDEMIALGTEMLILTGGEPLLRRDIYDIAKRASERGMWVVMGTNGVLVTDKVAQKMIECGVKGVGISIDSLDPEKHNQFRGGPKSWEYSVRALDICRDNGLEVLVQTTVMEMNYDEIPQIIEFAKEKGAWSCNLYFLVQTGRGQKMNDLTDIRTEDMLSNLVEMQDKYKPMLVRSKCAPQFKQIAYEKSKGGLESGGCMAGTQYCRITPEGEVTPCPYMNVVAGNIRKQSFTDIWQSSVVFSELRDLQQLKGRCGSCEFNELCGGCRCRAYAAFDDYLQEDPACRYQPIGKPLEFEEILWTLEARERLQKIPITFIREKVKKGLETFAQRNQIQLITTTVFKQAITGMERPDSFSKMPSFVKEKQKSSPERLV